MKLDATIERFIEVWGAMGSIWGISASVARVHALLLASEQAYTLDEICEALQIAKSNASTLVVLFIVRRPYLETGEQHPSHVGGGVCQYRPRGSRRMRTTRVATDARAASKHRASARRNRECGTASAVFFGRHATR